MKVLKDNQFNEMKEKADKFDAIVAAMTENSDDIKAEDITAELIIEAMSKDEEVDNDAISEAQDEIDKISQTMQELQSQLETANARVAELEQQLDETPAGQPATITSKGEPDGEKQTLAQFADKNKGDTASILEQAKADGLI